MAVLFRCHSLSVIQKYPRIQTILNLTIILAVNTFLILPLFFGGYTKFLTAIDGVFIADARFISQNWPYTGWNFLWYAGFPFDFFYTPLLPYLLAFLHRLSSNTLLIPDLYRMIGGLFYVLSPVSLYLFAKHILERELSALVAALAYSLLPFAYLIPDVFHDALPLDLAPWQLQVITRYADVPHVVSLSFVPIAALFFLRVLQAPSYRRYLLASCFIALTALLNWIGFFSLILIIAVIILSELLIGDVEIKIQRSLWCLALTFGFIAFWYTPDFIEASVAYGSRGVQPLMLVFIAILGLTSMILIVPVFYYQRRRQFIVIIGGWFCVFFTILFSYYFLTINLVPEPYRYVLELAMAASMLFSIAVTKGIDRLKTLKNERSKIMFSRGFNVALILLFIIAFLSTVGPSWNISQAHPNITDSSEYQVAHWLSENILEGERVYATGSHSFWLNAFSDIPQVSGGSTLANTNGWWEAVMYNIDKYHDGHIATLWARVFNVKYIVVNFPNSTVPYKNYNFPNKFEGLLERVYEWNGDVVYEVPLLNPSIAQIVYVEQMNSLDPIENVIDLALRDYVATIDHNSTSSMLEILKLNPSEIVLNASIREGQAIQIQMTYDPGWKAYSEEGQKIPVESDPLGFILISPASGEQIIQMQYTSKPSVYIGRTITGLIVIGVIVYSTWRRVRHT